MRTKFNLENAIKDIFEETETMYKSSEITHDELMSVAKKNFNFTENQLEKISKYIKKEEKRMIKLIENSSYANEGKVIAEFNNIVGVLDKLVADFSLKIFDGEEGKEYLINDFNFEVVDNKQYDLTFREFLSERLELPVNIIDSLNIGGNDLLEIWHQSGRVKTVLCNGVDIYSLNQVLSIYGTVTTPKGVYNKYEIEEA